jgi:alpha-methylacyl-CoA racemase
MPQGATPSEPTPAAGRHGGPLAGVRAIELEGMGPVPFAGMLLADMGAQVLRLDRPVRRARRALTETEALDDTRDVVKRGRRSVTVDLKSARGAGLALELCERAEVLIEGFRPGAAERLGLGPADVHARNPRLVYARLTGYGQAGPMSHAAGHDINYVAMSGLLHAISRSGERPLPPLNLLADFAGGGMLAAFGIVSALLESRLSGRGQVIDVSMVDGVALLGAKINALRTMESWSDEPGTNFIDGGAPFYDVYRTSDGKHIAVGALEPDFYRELLRGLEVDTSQWPQQADRAAWPLLRKLLAGVFETRTRDEWAARFEGRDACVSPVLTMDEAAAHPHNAARSTYIRPGGILQPAPAPRFSRTGAVPGKLPRAARDDPAEVLQDWHMDPGRLDELRRDGVIGS